MTAARPFLTAKAAYEAAAHMLHDTLVVAYDDGARAFVGLPVSLRTKLTSWEREWLAWAALISLDAPDARDVMMRVLSIEERAGPPLVPFPSVEEEANDWADWASPDELWFYGLACLSRLSASKRSALWQVLKRVDAA